VRRDEILECVLVTGSGASERGVGHGHILASTADAAPRRFRSAVSFRCAVPFPSAMAFPSAMPFASTMARGDADTAEAP
jgi:hypothetical protein